MHQFPTTNVEDKGETYVLTLAAPDGDNTFTACILKEKADADPKFVEKMIDRLLLMYTDNARHKLLMGVYALKKERP